jgi:hypothetical protein
MKELKCKNILRRSGQIVLTHGKMLFFSFLGWGKISDEKEKNFCKIKYCFSMLFMETYLLIGYIILGPILLNCIVNYKNAGMMRIFFYLVILCVLLVMRLKGDTQKIIEILNIYIQNVMILLQRKPELLSYEDAEKPIIEWNAKKY